MLTDREPGRNAVVTVLRTVLEKFWLCQSPRNLSLLFDRHQNHSPGRLMVPSPNHLVTNIDSITYFPSDFRISILCHAHDFLISTHYLFRVARKQREERKTCPVDTSWKTIHRQIEKCTQHIWTRWITAENPSAPPFILHRTGIISSEVVFALVKK